MQGQEDRGGCGEDGELCMRLACPVCRPEPSGLPRPARIRERPTGWKPVVALGTSGEVEVRSQGIGVWIEEDAGGLCLTVWSDSPTLPISERLVRIPLDLLGGHLRKLQGFPHFPGYRRG